MTSVAASPRATMKPMPEDHGKNLPLSRVARAVFVTARELADVNGIVAERSRIGDELGLAPRTLRLWLGHLELRRFDNRALAKRRGAAELWVNCADIPGVPRRPRQESAADLQHYDRLGRRTGAKAWRIERAQLGGMKRALAEAIERRREAEAELEKISTKLYGDRQAETQLGVSADITTLRSDLQHAIACTADPCTRCGSIRDRLGTDRARYAKADELAGRIERLERAVNSGKAFLQVRNAQGVGAADRRMAALVAFQRALEET
jgi:hypothetical protein